MRGRGIGIASFLALLLAWVPRGDAATVHVSGSIQREIYVPGSGFSTQYFDSYDTTNAPGTGDGIHLDDVNIPEQSGMHVEADSYGGAGFVHGHTFAGWNRQVSSNSSIAYKLTGTSQVEATFEDLLISNAGGPSTITTSINFHLSGAQTVGSFVGTEGTSANTS